MSRVLCQKCQRPEKACICAFLANINNHISVVILQHPSEVTQSKGTVSLLQHSLANCEVIVGETFTDSTVLTQQFKKYAEKIVLLYPSEQAIMLDFSAPNSTKNVNLSELSDNKLSDIECIIILDGTWKKAYRMFMLNPCLHDIKHIVLPQGITSLYQIRKTKKDNALSSLEACCHALACLENEPEKYQKLLNNFVKFNQFHQSFSQRNV
ncbi:tRNA-uridine aminocarboxypropyltransferase [Cognaticolwellia beringensis]|uniref:tRNA-uridine aminocarboxypropyltransferase n=1 Tax=Cognaticolwellia beringensis TaxID=1967665 RepID=A0A222GD50_9GAMM|nr:tRNA-uridine aminocarboxypropyltransferase [Cognaticolwellia beringensis]ASP49797.1 DTW domain-containing protein [Cognaticolwellia beringensis]